MALEDQLVAAVREAARDRVAYVCYSGGVDSTVVLAASVRAGVETIALLGVSPSLATSQRAEAHRIAAEIGVRVEEVETNEMELAGYRANAGDRCYHCKSALYDTVLDEAEQPTGVDVVYLVVGKQTGGLAELRAGDRLEVWGPLGNGFPDLSGIEHVGLVAGGIGQTPFLAYIRELLGERGHVPPSLRSWRRHCRTGPAYCQRSACRRRRSRP